MLLETNTVGFYFFITVKILDGEWKTCSEFIMGHHISIWDRKNVLTSSEGKIDGGKQAAE